MSDSVNIQKAQPLRRRSAKEWIMNKRLDAVGPLTRIHVKRVKRAAEELLLAAEGGIEAWRIDTHRRD
jgi:hypothetical protein